MPFNFAQMAAGRPPMGTGISRPNAPKAPMPQPPSVPARPVGRPTTGPNEAAAPGGAGIVRAMPRSAGWRRMATGSPQAPAGGSRGATLASRLQSGPTGSAGPFGGILGGVQNPAAQVVQMAPAAGAGMGAAPAAKNAATTAAGAMGGWNANPQFSKMAANFLKAGAELSPQHRAAMSPILRQTDPPGQLGQPRQVGTRSSPFDLSKFMQPGSTFQRGGPLQTDQSGQPRQPRQVGTRSSGFDLSRFTQPGWTFQRGGLF